MTRKLLPALVVLAAGFAEDALAQISYPIQDVLIGADKVQALGYTGAGVTFGVIDTGVAAPFIGFAPGQILPAPPSACLVTPTCSRNRNQYLAVTDDNGHGSFVASEMVDSVPLSASTSGSQVYGVAPGGSVLAVKVLNSQGSGSYSDVANGIMYAVDHGARILNLSLGPYTSSLNSAVNYAASKGALIVFAGGNTGGTFNNGQNISGLTDQAIQSLIFVGSTNAQESISSFSTKPGTGGFVSTTGRFYSYQSRWLVADGENLWGASNYHTSRYGYSYITQLSGTSMAAPQAAASAGLLLQEWSYLNGAQLAASLLATGQDLGAKGADATYGEGFLNVYAAATTPVGTLSVPLGGGGSAPVNGSRIGTSGALGKLSGLSAALSRAVGFDSIGRDFPLALSSAIGPKPATASATATAIVLGQTGGGARHLTDLGDDNWVAASFTGSYSAPVSAAFFDMRPNPAFIVDPTHPEKTDWSLGFQQSGTYIGVGQGGNAALSFSDARWGGKSAFFNGDADASAQLLGLPSGASFAAAGFDLGAGSRFAFGLVTASDDTLASLGGGGASAKGFELGYTVTPVEGWKVSLTSGVLSEHRMFLGSVSNGILSLGPSASTALLGIGTDVALGDGYRLGFDAAYATTSASAGSTSLITGTSRVSSAAFGIAMSKDHLTDADDSLGAALRKPFRVYAGSASLGVPVGADSFGNPIIQQTHAGLTPTGNETDLELGYNRILGPSMSGGLNFTFRQDADNVAGARDAAAMVRFKANF